MKTFNLKLSQNHMATTFDFLIAVSANEAASAEQTLYEAHRKVESLENTLSEFLPTSPIYELNSAPVGTRVPLPKAAIELLNLSESAKIQTGCAFDALAKSRTQNRGIAWNESHAWRLTEDTHVGFGAIGKGYALDCVRTMLERDGFSNYCLSAGGSSIVLAGFSDVSEQAREHAWQWAWSWTPVCETPMGIPFRHTSGIRVAIGVSGTQVRGQHIIDPLSNKMREAEFKSALVACPSATFADAYSTALFVAGWEKTTETLKDDVYPPAMAIVRGDDRPMWNGVFQNLWPSISLFLFLLPTFCFSAGDASDTGIDLKDLGVDDFTPYMFDRSALWILLPAAMLAFVFLHLKKTQNNPRNTPGNPKD
jgi:FAD:protein FMN transferase